METEPTEVRPTYRGRVATKRDARILLDRCVQGVLFHVPRGPYADGRNVQSENVYIYKQSAYGITEWKDGKSWDLVREEDGFVFYVETTQKKLGKKTLEMVHKGQHHYLVAYYRVDGEIGPRPSQDLSLIDKVNLSFHTINFTC
jgi:hypothetical protein